MKNHVETCGSQKFSLAEESNGERTCLEQVRLDRYTSRQKAKSTPLTAMSCDRTSNRQSHRKWPRVLLSPSNYNSTKLRFAYFGFSPGGSARQSESMFSFLSAHPLTGKTKLLRQVRHFMRVADLR